MKEKKEKFALNDELLEKVSGGWGDEFRTEGSFVCPACHCETVDGQCGNPDCVYSIDYLTKHEYGVF